MYTAVPFPGVTIGLEVEQAAYKLMMRRSHQTNSLFGLIAIPRSDPPQQPGRVGCELEITRATHNGNKMIVEVRGRRRFMLDGADMMDGYLLGRVTYFEDFPPVNACVGAMLATRAKEARELIHQISEQLHRSACPVAAKMLQLVTESVPDDDNLLSFHIAGKLPVSMDIKLQWLEMRCPLMRLEQILAQMRTFTQKMWCSH